MNKKNNFSEIKLKERILVFSDCYIFGGSEKLISFLLTNEIILQKFELIFSYRKHREYEKGLQNENLLNKSNNFPLLLFSNETLFYQINCTTFPSFVKIFLKIPLYILEKLNIYSLWNLFVFIRLLHVTKPSIIHINNGGYPGAKSCNILVIANSIFQKAKIIYQVNNQARENNSAFNYYFDCFIAKQVFYFTTASFQSKTKLVDNRKFNSEKILIVNNCVPLSNIKINRNTICRDLCISLNSFIIVQVGFLTSRKGQIYAITAVERLLKMHPTCDIKLILIGNGEDEEILKKLIVNSKLDKNVFLLGYKNNSDDYIEASDIFLLPSIKDEDMPLVLLTALGSGKPIIATDLAGISQVIESGKNGILVPNNLDTFVDDLIDNIYKLFNDKVLRDYLATNASRTYEKFTPTNYGLRLKEIYESIK